MRYILNCDPDEAILAIRAAQSLERDGHKECIYVYENGVDMYARRNKASISVFQGVTSYASQTETPATEDGGS